MGIVINFKEARLRMAIIQPPQEPCAVVPALKRVPQKETRQLICAGGTNGGEIFRAPADSTMQCWSCTAAAAYLTPGATAGTFIGWCACHAGLDDKKAPA